MIDSFRHSFASISSLDSTSSGETHRTLESDAGRGRWSDHEDAFASMIARGDDEARFDEARLDFDERDANHRQTARSALPSFRGHQKRDSSTSTIRNRMPGGAPAFHIGQSPPAGDDLLADNGSIYSTESETWDEPDNVVEGRAQVLPDRHSRPGFRRVSSSGFRSVYGDTGDSWEADPTEPMPGYAESSSAAASRMTPGEQVSGEASSRRPQHRPGRIHHSRPAPPPPPVPASRRLQTEASCSARVGAQPVRTPAPNSYGPLRPPPELYELVIPDNGPVQERSTAAARPRLDRGNLSATSLSSTRSTPQEDAVAFLLKGIKLHAGAQREGDLAESTWQFRKAAEGGSLGGAVFYGERHRVQRKPVKGLSPAYYQVWHSGMGERGDAAFSRGT